MPINALAIARVCNLIPFIAQRQHFNPLMTLYSSSRESNGTFYRGCKAISQSGHQRKIHNIIRRRQKGISIESHKSVSKVVRIFLAQRSLGTVKFLLRRKSY